MKTHKGFSEIERDADGTYSVFNLVQNRIERSGITFAEAQEEADALERHYERMEAAFDEEQRICL